MFITDCHFLSYAPHLLTLRRGLLERLRLSMGLRERVRLVPPKWARSSFTRMVPVFGSGSVCVHTYERGNSSFDLREGQGRANNKSHRGGGNKQDCQGVYKEQQLCDARVL